MKTFQFQKDLRVHLSDSHGAGFACVSTVALPGLGFVITQVGEHEQFFYSNAYQGVQVGIAFSCLLRLRYSLRCYP